MPAVDTVEMREVDRIAIEETGPNLFQMMENAGRNLATVAREMLADGWEDEAIVILAGTGGNGGGGITAGRHLLNHGGTVSVAITDLDGLGAVPAQQLELFLHAGGTVVSDLPEHAGLIIDAVIGYSLAGPPRGAARELIEYANASMADVLSLDVPSGVDSTSGETPGSAVTATQTMTLALPKHGLCSPTAGSLLLADIGIPAETYRRLGRIEGADVFNGRYCVPLQRNLGVDD